MRLSSAKDSRYGSSASESHESGSTKKSLEAPPNAAKTSLPPVTVPQNETMWNYYCETSNRYLDDLTYLFKDAVLLQHIATYVLSTSFHSSTSQYHWNNPHGPTQSCIAAAAATFLGPVGNERKTSAWPMHASISITCQQSADLI